MIGIFLLSDDQDVTRGLADSTLLEHLLRHVGEQCERLILIVPTRHQSAIAGWRPKFANLPELEWHWTADSVWSMLESLQLPAGPIVLANDSTVIVPEAGQLKTFDGLISTYGPSAIVSPTAARLKEALPADSWESFLANLGQIEAVKPRKRYPAGNETEFLYANQRILGAGFSSNDALERSYTEEFAVIPPVYIDATATIFASVIGPYASIGPGALIEDSIVRSSIIETNAQVRSVIIESSYIGRAAEKSGTPETVHLPDSQADQVEEI